LKSAALSTFTAGGNDSMKHRDSLGRFLESQSPAPKISRRLRENFLESLVARLPHGSDLNGEDGIIHFEEATMGRLFQKSLYAIFEHVKALAVQEVDSLDRSIFNNPALGGVLQKIAAKRDLDVARFEGEITAMRRTEDQLVPDGFGDSHVVKSTLLDVRIPFVGDPETMRIMPSRCGVPDRQAIIERNALVITIPDDANAERTIEHFKGIVSGNLQTLRAEYEQMKPQIEQAIQAAVDRRKVRVAAQEQLDKGRSFRVIG
jgi:hypothetical protein